EYEEYGAGILHRKTL
ncbi:actin-related protein ARP1, partial [Toxoplasma gondii RUB]